MWIISLIGLLYGYEGVWNKYAFGFISDRKVWKDDSCSYKWQVMKLWNVCYDIWSCTPNMSKYIFKFWNNLKAWMTHIIRFRFYIPKVMVVTLDSIAFFIFLRCPIPLIIKFLLFNFQSLLNYNPQHTTHTLKSSFTCFEVFITIAAFLH